MTALLPLRRAPVAVLKVTDLRPGDLLLSAGDTWEARLVRWLDDGAYDQAGLYDGEQVIACGTHCIERRPPHACDVYRFRNVIAPPGAGNLDPSALTEQASRYLRATGFWGAGPLYLAGQLAIMRRWAEPAGRRMIVEVFGSLFLKRLEEYVSHIPAGAQAITCSELITRIFQDASHATGWPYDIHIELSGRHRRPAWQPTSGRFEQLMQQIEEVLSQANPQLLEHVARARFAAQGQRGARVVAGGALAPACLVSPGDLAFSPSFVRLGRLELETVDAPVTAPSSGEAPSADGEPVRREERP